MLPKVAQVALRARLASQRTVNKRLKHERCEKESGPASVLGAEGAGPSCPSKLKASLRKGAERAVPHLRRGVGKLLASFTAADCANFFEHSGYTSN
jgi:hypothetical protein